MLMGSEFCFNPVTPSCKCDTFAHSNDEVNASAFNLLISFVYTFVLSSIFFTNWYLLLLFFFQNPAQMSPT